VDERGRCALPVGAGDPDDLVRRQFGAGAGEQLDVADDLDPRLPRTLRQRVGVERHARGDDQTVECGQVGAVEIDELGTFRGSPCLCLLVPRRDPRPAGDQRPHGRQPAPGQAKDGVMLARPGPGRDHLSFRVLSPASASTKAMIQKRITTVGSLQPLCSKWWWIGAIRNTRRPVRL